MHGVVSPTSTARNTVVKAPKSGGAAVALLQEAPRSEDDRGAEKKTENRIVRLPRCFGKRTRLPGRACPGRKRRTRLPRRSQSACPGRKRRTGTALRKARAGGSRCGAGRGGLSFLDGAIVLGSLFGGFFGQIIMNQNRPTISNDGAAATSIPAPQTPTNHIPIIFRKYGTRFILSRTFGTRSVRAESSEGRKGLPMRKKCG